MNSNSKWVKATGPPKSPFMKPPGIPPDPCELSPTTVTAPHDSNSPPAFRASNSPPACPSSTDVAESSLVSSLGTASATSSCSASPALNLQLSR